MHNYPIFSNKGINSNRKNPNICNWLVKMATPVNNRINPPTFVMTDMYFLELLEKNKNLSIKTPEIIKGIANPNE